MKRMIFVSICLSFCIASASAAGEAERSCQETESGRVNLRDGVESYYGGAIKYQSKALKIPGQTTKYIWCIENSIENYIVNIEWGDAKNPKKYFDGIVPPGEARPRIRTHSSGTGFSDRILKYRVNVDDWHQAEVETIYYKKLGYSYRDLVIRAQGNSAVLNEFLDEDNEVDIDKIRNDSAALDRFLKAGGSLYYISSGIFDIPRTYEVSTAIAGRSYKEYSKDDFFSVEMDYTSALEYNGEQNKLLTYLGVRYLTDDDRKKAEEGLLNHPVIINLKLNENASKILGIDNPYFLGAEKNDLLPVFYQTAVKSVDITSGEIEFGDKEGNSFGSIGVSAIIPN